DNKDFTFQARPWTAFAVIFNMRPNRILPKAVREAILMAADKQSMIQVQNLGIGVPLRTPFGWGPNQTGWCPIAACDQRLFAPYPYDPATAKQMVQSANWDASRELVILDSAGDPIGTLLQQELQAIGIKSSLNTNPDLLDKALTDGNYDLWMYPGGGWPNNNPISFCNYWVGDLATNYYYQRTGYANE